ncbi:hypothetical protein [Mycolicibacterium aubagnense]|uniref:Uncharacterized protein n=1 Tax=Mycolicibacterium aubagnense TaxID=319707 RepID=A0ABN5YUG7_9MYCO|nr:hypothetical protein [Mycolicibacterium aubagnense]WGI35752.1 hypothetical protein QDT91_00445 [Mycolicibacterium aubagnense]BBX85420.1 hypothetical protein MAUB_32930 [Mycolicibacterium aubagnense]
MTGESIEAELAHPDGVGSANVGSPGAFGSKVVSGTFPVVHPTALAPADDDTAVVEAAELDAPVAGCCDEHPAATTTTPHNTPKIRS